MLTSPLLTSPLLTSPFLDGAAAVEAATAETAPVLWYANRGSGFVLLGLLTVATAAGVLATSAPGSRGWPRAATQSLHRNIGLLAALFLAIHAVTAAVDEFVQIRWWDTLVPFFSAYERWWLGVGVVAVDLLVAVILTSLLRHRMTHLSWRVVHVLAYAVWALGAAHGLALGTDATTRWGLSFSVGCALVVAAAVGARVTSLGSRPPAAGAPTATPVKVTRRMSS